MNKKSKILFFVTEDWYFYSHRLPLALGAIKEGYEVYLVTKTINHGNKIKNHGINLISLDINRGKISPFADFILLIKLIKILYHIKPNIVHNVALKPILYGSIAAFITRIPNCINNFAGLGYIFISNSIKAKVANLIIKPIFSLLLNRKNNRSIFQNQDDLDLLVRNKFVNKNCSIIIRGSGVDMSYYKYVPEDNSTNNVILASRLLWDKGIGEFINACKIIMKNNIDNVRFIIVGAVDNQNPSSIKEIDLLKWQKDNIIEWWGYKNNINEVYSDCNIVCLPSYREGLPKSLIEAAACGRAIITTDVPGCREIVLDGYNGILIPKKNTKQLAIAIQKLLNEPATRNKMGRNGVKHVRDNFTIENIVTQYITLYNSMIK